ncbi:MAG: hypothetical protein QXL94_01590 [Candidatus Parvarchaeum sp.]
MKKIDKETFEFMVEKVKEIKDERRIIKLNNVSFSFRYAEVNIGGKLVDVPSIDPEFDKRDVFALLFDVWEFSNDIIMEVEFVNNFGVYSMYATPVKLEEEVNRFMNTLKEKISES